jgi:hypothetical protein
MTDKNRRFSLESILNDPQELAEIHTILTDRAIRTLIGFLNFDRDYVERLLRHVMKGTISTRPFDAYIKFEDERGSISFRWTTTTDEDATIRVETQLSEIEFMCAKGQWHVVSCSILGKGG